MRSEIGGDDSACDIRSEPFVLLGQRGGLHRRLSSAAPPPFAGRGKVVYEDNGRPMIDDGPNLAAIDRLVKISESHRKLLGLDQEPSMNVEQRDIVTRCG